MEIIIFLVICFIIFLLYLYKRLESKKAINNIKKYTPLAKKGNARAQNRLGLLYYRGKGITRDYQQAAEWIRLSAEQGYALAQHNLGQLYYEGKGVPQSMIHAYMWTSIAKSNGNKKAKKYLKEIERRLNTTSLQRAQAKAVRCIDSDYTKCS